MTPWYSILKHFGEGRGEGIKRKYMFANGLSVPPGNHEESKKAPKCPDSTEPLSLSKGKLHHARGTSRAHRYLSQETPAQRRTPKFCKKVTKTHTPKYSVKKIQIANASY